MYDNNFVPYSFLIGQLDLKHAMGSLSALIKYLEVCMGLTSHIIIIMFIVSSLIL